MNATRGERLGSLLLLGGSGENIPLGRSFGITTATSVAANLARRTHISTASAVVLVTAQVHT